MYSKLDINAYLNTVSTFAKSNSDGIDSDTEYIIKLSKYIQDNCINPLFICLIYNLRQSVTDEINKFPFPRDFTFKFSSNIADTTANITTKEQKLVRFISKIYENELKVLKDYCERNIFNIILVGGGDRKRWKNNACHELWHQWNLHDSEAIYMTSEGEDTYNLEYPTKYEKNNKGLMYNLVPNHLDNIPTSLELENIRHKVMKLKESLRLSHIKSKELRDKIKNNNILTEILKRIENTLVDTLLNGVEKIDHCCHDKDVNIGKRMKECQNVIKLVVSNIERLKTLISISHNLSSQLDNIKLLRKAETDYNNSTQEYTKVLGDACKYAPREFECRNDNKKVVCGEKRHRILTLDEEYELRKDIIQWPLTSKNKTLIKNDNEKGLVNVPNNMVLNELWKRMNKKVSLLTNAIISL